MSEQKTPETNQNAYTQPKPKTLTYLICKSVIEIAFISIFLTLVWNYAVQPIFTSVPDFRFGNTFVMLIGLRVIVSFLFSDLIKSIQDYISFFKIAAEVFNFNINSQGGAIIKLLNLINQKDSSINEEQKTDDLAEETKEEK